MHHSCGCGANFRRKISGSSQLRGRETAGSDELYAQVKEQYTTLTDAIRELASN